MIRWRQLAVLTRSLGGARDSHLMGAATESTKANVLSRVTATRTFSTAGSRHSAVTASEFADHLHAVGVSKETLHKLYLRKEDPNSHGWVAHSPRSFPIAVALSGGADSMALMLLLKEFLDAHNIETPLLAVTVDHRLRVESGDEARYVGGIATNKWGVRHVIMECDWQKENDLGHRRNGAPRKSKLQEEARSFRYELLADARLQYGVKCLFVAHNLGDQLETVLFRLGRASGINGLAGMAAKKEFVSGKSDSESCVLLRPLLHVSKPSLTATCKRFGQSWVEDPSNESLLFDRIRIRKALELIEESATGVEDIDALKTFQRIAATAKMEFDARENELLQSHVLHSEPAYVVLSAAILSDSRAFDELVIRVLSTLVRQIGGKDTPPRLSSLEGLLRDLRSLGSGKKVTLSGCCVTKMQRGSELHFRPEHTRTMRSTQALSSRPRESGRSSTKESRRRNEVGGEGEEAFGNADEDVEGSPDEEKLKVVVRVRPLQKHEEPWSVSSGAGEEDHGDHGTPGCQRRHGGGSSVFANNVSASTAVSESALSVHEKSVTWEKNGQIKMLLADAVFSGAATQDDVFHRIEDCIDGLLAGFDCSVFAYGQTGTGKTHTMSGLPRGGVPQADDCEDGCFTMSESFGVVPRAIQRLFDQIDVHAATEGNGISFSVYCSFVEIYNEKIYDILAADEGAPALTASGSTHHSPHDMRAGWNRPKPTKEVPSLHIRQKLDGAVFVDGLTSRRISSRAEMLRAFRKGSMNREVRDNLYNQHSSRGHSIFQVTLRKNVTEANNAQSVPAKGSTGPKRPPSTSSTQAGSNAGSSKSRLSRLFFVDLAGSEKWHVNGSDLSDRYATELSSINKSLSALTNCVLALTQKERAHVPYRDSVLTRLLQSCLQGQGRTAFIVTISPARESLEESFATLRFAERLKALRCRPLRRKVFANEPLAGEQRVYYENQIRTMRMEVDRLRDLLKKAHRRNQEIADSNTAAVANAALLEENRRLKELLMHSERNRLAERGDRLSGKPPKKPSALVSVNASPQRQAAKQILASGQRPFSEEETASKSITASDMSGDPDSTRMLPSTPQLRLRSDRNDNRGDVSESVSSDEKEYSTLINRLQNKEARLNWMLEAELEAQNTRSSSLSMVEKAGMSQNNKNEGDPTPVGKSVNVTRSWAVERVLRKNLVVVPPPVRTGSSVITQDTTALQTGAVMQTPPSPRPIPAALDAVSFNSVGHRSTAQATRVPTPRGDVKMDSPRHPATTSPGVGSQAPKSAYAPFQPTKVLTARAPPPSTARIPKGVAASPTPAVKSASLLKLVGSAEMKGRSREELVDDYKRARRAELEAMLRTMVHQ